jgi:hypothetical protein
MNEDVILSPSKKSYHTFFETITSSFSVFGRESRKEDGRQSKPDSKLDILQNNTDFLFSFKSRSSSIVPNSSDESNPVHTRLIDRGGEFFQSAGKVALRKKIARRDWRALYSMDWFHSLVDAPTIRIVIIVMTG